LRLPTFSLRPESFFHKIGAAIGMQDIDFEEHADFSDNFVLTGDDEQLVRQFFDNGLLNEFANAKESASRLLRGVLSIFVLAGVSLIKFGNT